MQNKMLNIKVFTLISLITLGIGNSCAQSLKEEKLTANDIRLKYNNDSLIVDLGVGLWGIPMPYDFDGDGKTDLLISCPDFPYKGIYFFKNIGTNENPLFDKAIRKSDIAPNNIKSSVVDNKFCVIEKGTEYIDFPKFLFKNKKEISYTGEILGENYKRSRSNMWSYVDWDADGDQDIIVGIDTWDDYGWDNAYDEKGVWKNGSLHGYVYLLENIDGNYINKGKIEAGGKIIDVYGAPNPCMADFDGDGDLDLICGEFVDGLTWFENIGTRTKPVFSDGKQLKNENGDIRFHIEMIVPVAFDFNNDGHTDLIVGDEDGRIALVKHTGKVKDNMPIFHDPVYLKQKADNLKFGALSTPFSIDWDSDGIEDLIVGNSAGNIAFIKNLTGGENPSWAEPQLLKVDGKPIHIQAGENGSIQGPAERKWGYTVLSVADWDGDGRNDIIINSIWGKIEWFRNTGSDNHLELAAAQPVKVKWDGEPAKPKWNWWNPEPNTLVTQWRTTPVAIDWNRDGLTDLRRIDHEGYLAYYERFRDEKGELWLKPGQRTFYGTNCSLYDHIKGVGNNEPGILRLNQGEAGRSGRRKICFIDWNNDGKLDLVVDSRNAALFENKGEKDGKVFFEYKGNISDIRLAGHTTSPTAVDWNNDGIKDLLIGAEDGHFYIIRNTNK